MENLMKVSEGLADAFGVERMIEIICQLSNEQVLKLMTAYE